MNETRMDRLENFINRHKVGITIAVTATISVVATAALSKLANNGTMEFIKSDPEIFEAYNNFFDEN